MIRSAQSDPVVSPGIVWSAPDLPPSLDEAVLLVDKPKGWSSFDVIRKMRRLLSVRKIGHAGTLDPMATGLLICLIGKATKKMEAFMGLEKVYIGTLRLGETTASYDAETPVIDRIPAGHLTDVELDRIRGSFVGAIEQTPPMYSAVKVEGRRLYERARKGEEIARPVRTVSIYDFDILARRGNDVDFRVRCSKGTYIRSLAHDFGHAAGVGAHLVALRRTSIGPYDVEGAWTIEELEGATATARNA